VPVPEEGEPKVARRFAPEELPEPAPERPGLITDALGLAESEPEPPPPPVEGEEQVAEEEQFLQRMRNMFAGDFATKAPADVVKQKKEKMEEVKSRIAQMQYEINKIKMERK
jgi:hypothetical protein